MDCFACARNDGTRTPPAPCEYENRNYAGTNFFIIFADAIFTNLFERLFTKVFDVTRANPWISCLCRACNGD